MVTSRRCFLSDRYLGFFWLGYFGSLFLRYVLELRLLGRKGEREKDKAVANQASNSELNFDCFVAI